MIKRLSIFLIALCVAATAFATVSTNPGRNEYTAGAAQTIFNYTFKIYADTDLSVYLTPVGQTPDDATDITTAYTVAGAGDDAGGSITLNSGTTSGDLVTIVSSIPTNRTIDYQFNGDFRPNVVNNDFDRAVSLVKQIEDISDRTLRYEDSVQGDLGLLPAPEVGTVLGYNVSGDIDNLDYNLGGVWSGENVTTYATLKALTGQIQGSQSLVAGRVSEGDGGAGAFYWEVGDFSTEVTADAQEGIYVAPNTDPTGASGVWVRQYRGPVDVRWFGAVCDYTLADGTINPTPTDNLTAMQAAFDLQDIRIEGGDCMVTNTLTIQHPFTLRGGEGAAITLTTGGGLAGKDLIQITTDETLSGFAKSSLMSGVDLYTAGADAKYAVSTPNTDYAGGSVWALTRPNYVFENMAVSGKTRTGGGASTATDESFAICFRIGDSDGARLTSVRIAGALTETADMSIAPQTTYKETIGVFYDAPNAGAVYKPQIEDCNIVHIGIAVKYGEEVSNPRINNSQFARSYRGIYSTLDLTTQDGLSEAQFSNLNLNTIRSPIDIDSTDFLQITNVRSSRSSDYSTVDVEDWHGLVIREYCRSLLVANMRIFVSNGAYTGDFWGMHIKGGRDVTLTGIYAREDILAGGGFESVIQLLNPETAAISNVVAEGALLVSVIDVIADVDQTVLNPRIKYSDVTIEGTTPTVFTLDTANYSAVNIRGGDYARYESVATATTLTEADDTDTLTHVKGVNEQLVRFIAAGTSAYSYNIDFDDDGAIEGDVFKLWLQFNAAAGVNPTINIQIEGVTQVTIVGTSVLKKYGFELVHDGTNWIITSGHQLL